MSKLGDELVQSMAQALAHAQGKRSGVRTHKVAVRNLSDPIECPVPFRPTTTKTESHEQLR
jgi:hypothetical protein